MPKTVSIFTLCPVDVRKKFSPEIGEHQEFGFVDALTNEGDIVSFFITKEHIPEIVENHFYILKNVPCGEQLRTDKRTIIFQTEPFPLEENKRDSYLNPDCFSVSECTILKEQRRVSVKGSIKSVGVLVNGTTKRRFLTLEDEIGGTIMVKLWGEKALLDIPPTTCSVQITCLRVQDYNGRKSLSSTNLTEIIPQDSEETTTFTTTGATFRPSPYILAGEKMYSVPDDIMRTLYPNGYRRKTVKVTLRGSRIVTATEVAAAAAPGRAAAAAPSRAAAALEDSE